MDYFIDPHGYAARHRDDSPQGRADGIARDFFFLRGGDAYEGSHEALVLEATACATVAYRIADQIEAQTKPPRIPEPGLWGVVEAPVAPGGYVWQWVHHPQDVWLNAEGDSKPWDALIDPTLIREGVES